MRVRVKPHPRRSATSASEELVLRLISREELRELLIAYVRGARSEIVVGVRDLERLLVTTASRTTNVEDMLARLGTDGWLVISPCLDADSKVAGIAVKGRLRSKSIAATYNEAGLRFSRRS